MHENAHTHTVSIHITKSNRPLFTFKYYSHDCAQLQYNTVKKRSANLPNEHHYLEVIYCRGGKTVK